MNIYAGATINGEHTLHDWHCAITNSDVITTPEANSNYLEIPGRNGRLDVSDVLTGDVTYQNRTVKMQLVCSINHRSWYERCLHIFNAYHGRMVKVVFDDDPEHFYQGRAFLSDPVQLRNAGQLQFTVDADPFRYETRLYTKEYSDPSGTTVAGTIENTRMPVCPTIIVPNDCTITMGDVTYRLLSGTQQLPSLILPEGITAFTLSGTDKITFSFRRGCL